MTKSKRIAHAPALRRARLPLQWPTPADPTTSRDHHPLSAAASSGILEVTVANRGKWRSLGRASLPACRRPYGSASAGFDTPTSSFAGLSLLPAYSFERARHVATFAYPTE